MALTRADKNAALIESGYVAGFEDATERILGLLTDAEHDVFFAGERDAPTAHAVLLTLIDAVKELEYGTIPTDLEG